MKRTTAVVISACATLIAVVGGGVAMAAGDDVVASCTDRPVVEDVDGAQQITVVCTIPRPAAATQTVTVPGPTQTVTVAPTTGPTRTVRPTPTTSASADPSETASDDATPSSSPVATPTATTSTTATTAPPTTRTGCAPRPSACGYPDETNTGVPAGESLKAIDGAFDCTKGCGAQGHGWHVEDGSYIRVDQPGAVVSNITTGYGLYLVGASDAVVKNTRISFASAGGFAVQVRGDNAQASNDVTIQDSEFTNSGGGYETTIYDTGTTGLRVLRVDMSGFGGGMQVTSSFTIRDSYIHDLSCRTSKGGACTGGSDDGHINGIQSSASGGATIVHNTIFNPHGQTDAVMLTNDFGSPQRDDLVQDNLLAGGGYTIYGGNTGSGGACSGGCSNIRILDNRIARLYFPRGGYWGWMTAQAPGESNVTSGNVWDDTGEPVR